MLRMTMFRRMRMRIEDENAEDEAEDDRRRKDR